MKYFFQKFKKQLLRLLAAVLVFGAAMLVLLYFLGYYDFSFLDRYKVLGVIFEDPLPQTQTGPSMFFDPSELLGDDYTEEDALPEDSMQTAETPSQGTSDAVGGGNGVDLSNYETKSVKGVYDAAKLADKLLRSDKTGAFTVDKLLEDGYRLSGISYSEAGLNFVPPAEPEPAEGEEPADGGERNEADSIPKVVTGTFVPGETVLGRMTFSFQLPERYSMRTREKLQKIVHYPLDDSEYYVTEKTVKEQRPAIELYMGYILMDDGKTLSMIASDATPLSVMDETVYTPAFARDRYDRPLFYRVSETGETQYVYLAMDGKNFIRTEYDVLEEGRGLNFDYPASYGKTDSSITIDKNGVTGKMAYVNKGVGMVTGYDFTEAYAFSEGLAAVTTTKNRNGMYFIDATGKRAFETWIYYFNEHNRDGYANLVKPLTTGIENIGFYYFDHGLTRVHGRWRRSCECCPGTYCPDPRRGKRP